MSFLIRGHDYLENLNDDSNPHEKAEGSDETRIEMLAPRLER